MKPLLSSEQQTELLQVLKKRFEKYAIRHKGIEWDKVQNLLEANPSKLYSVFEMEQTGGEPDVVVFDDSEKVYFVDCSEESPKGRRSLCYDQEALDSRKEYKPENNVLSMATAMGIELLTEAQYRKLQEYDAFDTKTSSWIFTPAPIRQLGGALFADYRYGNVFVYHNGASSYYAARGFRGILQL